MCKIYTNWWIFEGTKKEQIHTSLNELDVLSKSKHVYNIPYHASWEQNVVTDRNLYIQRNYCLIPLSLYLILLDIHKYHVIDNITLKQENFLAN